MTRNHTMKCVGNTSAMQGSIVTMLALAVNKTGQGNHCLTCKRVNKISDDFVETYQKIMKCQTYNTDQIIADAAITSIAAIQKEFSGTTRALIAYKCLKEALQQYSSAWPTIPLQEAPPIPVVQIRNFEL